MRWCLTLWLVSHASMATSHLMDLSHSSDSTRANEDAFARPLFQDFDEIDRLENLVERHEKGEVNLANLEIEYIQGRLITLRESLTQRLENEKERAIEKIDHLLDRLKPKQNNVTERSDRFSGASPSNGNGSFQDNFETNNDVDKTRNSGESSQSSVSPTSPINLPEDSKSNSSNSALVTLPRGKTTTPSPIAERTPNPDSDPQNITQQAPENSLTILPGIKPPFSILDPNFFDRKPAPLPDEGKIGTSNRPVATATQTIKSRIMLDEIPTQSASKTELPPRSDMPQTAGQLLTMDETASFSVEKTRNETEYIFSGGYNVPADMKSYARPLEQTVSSDPVNGTSTTNDKQPDLPTDLGKWYQTQSRKNNVALTLSQ